MKCSKKLMVSKDFYSQVMMLFLIVIIARAIAEITLYSVFVACPLALARRRLGEIRSCTGPDIKVRKNSAEMVYRVHKPGRFERVWTSNS